MPEQPASEHVANEQPALSGSDAIPPKPGAPAPGFQLRDFSVYLSVHIPIAFLVLGLIESLGLVWRPIAGAFYLILLAASLFILLGMSLSKELAKPGQEVTAVSVVVVAGLFAVVSFSQFSRYLYLWRGGFTASQSGYWHWLRFGIANLLESILFDIPAIYNWNVTEILGVKFWSRTLVFIFRTSIEFLIVAQSIRAIGFARRTWGSVRSSQHNHYIGLMLSKLGWLLVIAIWAIPLAVSIGAIANDGLALDSTLTVLKLGSPLILGGWLAWESFRAFFSMNGIWNRIMALGGIALGVWLIRANWPMFIAFVRLE